VSRSACALLCDFVNQTRLYYTIRVCSGLYDDNGETYYDMVAKMQPEIGRFGVMVQ